MVIMVYKGRMWNRLLNTSFGYNAVLQLLAIDFVNFILGSFKKEFCIENENKSKASWSDYILL